VNFKVAIEGPRDPGEHVAMFQLKHKKEFGEILCVSINVVKQEKQVVPY